MRGPQARGNEPSDVACRVRAWRAAPLIAAHNLSILNVRRATCGLHLVPNDGTARRWDDSAPGSDACQGAARRKFTGESSARRSRARTGAHGL